MTDPVISVVELDDACDYLDELDTPYPAYTTAADIEAGLEAALAEACRDEAAALSAILP